MQNIIEITPLDSISVDTVKTDKKLFVQMRENHRNVMQKREAENPDAAKSIFNKDTSFDGTNDFSDLSEMTGIENLSELIEKHRIIVGEAFSKNKNGMLFIEEKVGVFDLKKIAESKMEISFFVTDYFTHRVFRSIYKELISGNHPIGNVSKADIFKYRPFLTSFGVNAVLVAGEEMVFVERSININTENPIYHIMVNEGMVTDDLEGFDNPLLGYVRRGFLEEIGITEKILSRFGAKERMLGIFFEKNNFELGLSASIEVDCDFRKEIATLPARDKELEIARFQTVLNNPEAINRFLSEEEFIPHGKHTVKLFLSS